MLKVGVIARGRREAFAQDGVIGIGAPEKGLGTNNDRTSTDVAHMDLPPPQLKHGVGHGDFEKTCKVRKLYKIGQVTALAAMDRDRRQAFSFRSNAFDLEYKMSL